MFETGLVSVSFRQLSPTAILDAAAAANIPAVEWGSDVHAPPGDRSRLLEIAAEQARRGIVCCSYGTYFRLGTTPLAELPAYIAAAQTLGTDILRLWCGEKGSAEYAAAEAAALLADCRAAARMAQDAGVTLCLECHPNTYTDTLTGALTVMQAVDSPALRMYWQPNQFHTVEDNIAYAEAIAPYTVHIHVFNWTADARYPLADGIPLWRSYLAAFGGRHRLLLEFMPDDRPESLPAEADALRELTGGVI